ncbi:MAG: hypothetical protein QCI00_05820, partial [Candidatus Thermoplasmatota archaeon]|nr:hypothetical protein [Candidatus Thermoplasmatota archaeon]
MDKKKFLIGLIACMFLFSTLPNIIGEQAADTNTFQERRFIEGKDLKGVYTLQGTEKVPGTKGKPGAYVTITNPANGAIVSGTVSITVDSNYDPTITIDGTTVAVGLSY